MMRLLLCHYSSLVCAGQASLRFDRLLGLAQEPRVSYVISAEAYRLVLPFFTHEATSMVSALSIRLRKRVLQQTTRDSVVSATGFAESRGRERQKRMLIKRDVGKGRGGDEVRHEASYSRGCMGGDEARLAEGFGPQFAQQRSRGGLWEHWRLQGITACRLMCVISGTRPTRGKRADNA